MAIRITAIHLEGGSGHEHIEQLRWVQDGTGDTGTSGRDAIVKYIEDGDTAYVQEPGTTRSTVGVVTPSSGRKYLRTYADGDWNNNLLSLPKF